MEMSVLDPAGPQASAIASLWWLYELVAIAVYVAVVLVFGFAIVRAMRARPHDPTQRDLGRERRMHRVMAAAAVTTVVILTGLLVASLRTGSRIAALDTSAQPITIRIAAHQWWWELDYDGTFTANEVHVPIGQPVHLVMTSSDVIHSLWIPNLHGKKDLIPGRTTEMTIEVDTPGRFAGQCAEFCGVQHARMRLEIVAEPPAVFERWLADQRADARVPATPEAQRGEAVFMSRSCNACHTIQGTSARGHVGPDLTHVASRSMIAAGELPNNRGNLGGWVIEPDAVKPGTKMPPTAMTSVELDALISYLESLR